MKIRQTTFYALKAVHRIHVEEGDIITSNMIAEKEGFSQGVVLRILRTLVNVGILEAHQGRGRICGGFSLKKPIDKITLFDIISVMENIDICSNLDEKSKTEENKLFCSLNQINQHIKDEFSKYTLRNLFEL